MQHLDFFFYGTLMSGHRGRLFEGIAELVGPATVRGDLYAVSQVSFPALLHGDGIVHGEHWRATPDTLARVLHTTDSIEGYRPRDRANSMYLRELAPLLDSDVQAWVYVWNSPLSWLTPIESGSWREYVDAIDWGALRELRSA